VPIVARHAIHRAPGVITHESSDLLRQTGS